MERLSKGKPTAAPRGAGENKRGCLGRQCRLPSGACYCSWGYNGLPVMTLVQQEPQHSVRLGDHAVHVAPYGDDICGLLAF